MNNPRTTPFANLKAYQLLYQLQDHPQLDLSIKRIKDKVFSLEEISENEYDLLNDYWLEMIFPKEKEPSRLSP